MSGMMPQVSGADAGAVMERVVVHGDLSKLSASERTTYYNAVCQSVGLNPLTRPFEYIRLNGKEVLYAKKDCTDQLRQVHGVSIEIVGKEVMDGLIVVTARATTRTGKRDEDMGAVPLPPTGEARANAMMKALTKAKRRVTLSVCGLGFLDESEVESIPGTQTGAREVPNMAPPEPGTPAATFVQLQAPDDEGLPMLSPDGELIEVRAKGLDPSITRWMGFCRRAVAKVAQDGSSATRHWAQAMEPHFVAIAPTYPDEVEAIRQAITRALDGLAQAEGEDEAA